MKYFSIAIVVLLIAGCAHTSRFSNGFDDQIVIAGQRVHTGVHVVLWNAGGFDGYVPGANGKQFFNVRFVGPVNLQSLRQKVDQIVLHYDACGSSAQCFHVLHDVRGLSVHFMIDVDGTIYQTLDVKERAWHATKANSRSVGIEIANLGAFPVEQANLLELWHRNHPQARLAVGEVQGKLLRMYDFTPRQYESLEKLAAALCRTLPRIRCDYPRDRNGRLVTHVLSNEEFANFEGILGHYHVQAEKIDPGPAMQWDVLVNGARREMSR